MHRQMCSVLECSYFWVMVHFLPDAFAALPSKSATWMILVDPLTRWTVTSGTPPPCRLRSSMKIGCLRHHMSTAASAAIPVSIHSMFSALHVVPRNPGAAPACGISEGFALDTDHRRSACSLYHIVDSDLWLNVRKPTPYCFIRLIPP